MAGCDGLPNFAVQPRLLQHARLVLKLAAQPGQDHALRSADIAQQALQLVGTQDDPSQSLDLPQQGAHVGRIIAILDCLQVGFGQRRFHGVSVSGANPHTLSQRYFSCI